MAHMDEYAKSMTHRRKDLGPEERRTLALEQIADQMWGIHMELVAIREKMPRLPGD